MSHSVGGFRPRAVTVDQFDELWRGHRAHVLNVAYRMLGNIGDAEDVVQEAFARLSRADLDSIRDVRGWLVVVVGRLCLDHLGTARVRRERQHAPDSRAFASGTGAVDPADRITLDDSVREAFLVVLQQLTPAERTVFVLHDVFQYPFETVADIVGRTATACRQLASRARHRIETRAPESARFVVELSDERRIADEFVVACAGGDVRALVQLLDPGVVGHARVAGVAVEQVGRDRVLQNVLRFFANPGITLVTQLVDGRAGVFAFRNRELLAVLAFDTDAGVITHIDGVADPRIASSATA
ncbi:MAG TPA: sigma-70 family RNA polymerase sigma factor [Acidimicrobiia bacterium]|nr:sigma-70 family RNA polymerase sigma factor [Acidimicrobiia bacterium]